MLSSVMYVSRSVHPRGHPSDIAILQQAQRNNARRNLTGCLLRGRSWFAQVLEGPKDALATTFDSIAQDPRHIDLQSWNVNASEERRFASWRMIMVEAEDAIRDHLCDTSHRAESRVARILELADNRFGVRN